MDCEPSASNATDCSMSDPREWAIFKQVNSELVDRIKMFYVFGEKGTDALFVTDDDQVYGVGLNELGCLGLGNTSAALQPKLVPELCNNNITKFANGGGSYVAALMRNGEVFYWASASKPVKVGGELKSKKAVDIACGSAEFLALTDHGDTYFWGVNVFGRESHKWIANVTSIACGASSRYAITDGKIVSSGSNEFGQLGNGWVLPHNDTFSKRAYAAYFTEILPETSKATQIACGRSHCVALTDKGHVYAWGNNTQGQVGSLASQITNGYLFGSSKVSVSSILPPVRVAEDIGKVAQVAAVPYRDLSASLTCDGRVYVWGMGIKTPTLSPAKSLQEAFSCYGPPSVTYRPIEVTRGPAALNVSDSIRKAFDDPATSDVKFKLDGKLISVHRAILSIRCEYFRKMFTNQFKESSQDVIKIENHTFPVYRAFLSYLYTDDIDSTLSLEQLIELFSLANCYCEFELKRECESLIRAKLTPENAAAVYTEAVKTKSSSLQELALQFAARNLKAVTASQAFRDLTHDRVIEFTAQAVSRGDFS